MFLYLIAWQQIFLSFSLSLSLYVLLVTPQSGYQLLVSTICLWQRPAILCQLQNVTSLGVLAASLEAWAVLPVDDLGDASGHTSAQGDPAGPSFVHSMVAPLQIWLSSSINARLSCFGDHNLWGSSCRSDYRWNVWAI